MNPRLPPDTPVHSLAFRKLLMIAAGVVFFAGFVPVVLHYKGLIDVEAFGVPETYLYAGGFAACFVGLISVFVVWRCPGCGAYLGKEGSPSQCPKCGAKFGGQESE